MPYIIVLFLILLGASQSVFSSGNDLDEEYERTDPHQSSSDFEHLLDSCLKQRPSLKTKYDFLVQVASHVKEQGTEDAQTLCLKKFILLKDENRDQYAGHPEVFFQLLFKPHQSLSFQYLQARYAHEGYRGQQPNPQKAREIIDKIKRSFKTHPDSPTKRELKERVEALERRNYMALCAGESVTIELLNRVIETFKGKEDLESTNLVIGAKEQKACWHYNQGELQKSFEACKSLNTVYGQALRTMVLFSMKKISSEAVAQTAAKLFLKHKDNLTSKEVSALFTAYLHAPSPQHIGIWTDMKKAFFKFKDQISQFEKVGILTKVLFYQEGFEFAYAFLCSNILHAPPEILPHLVRGKEFLEKVGSSLPKSLQGKYAEIFALSGECEEEDNPLSSGSSGADSVAKTSSKLSSSQKRRLRRKKAKAVKAKEVAQQQEAQSKPVSSLPLSPDAASTPKTSSKLSQSQKKRLRQKKATAAKAEKVEKAELKRQDRLKKLLERFGLSSPKKKEKAEKPIEIKWICKDKQVEGSFKTFMSTDKFKEFEKDLQTSPWEASGSGRPEVLRRKFKGYHGCLSRRINREDRFVYKVVGPQSILVLSVKGHY